MPTSVSNCTWGSTGLSRLCELLACEPPLLPFEGEVQRNIEPEQLHSEQFPKGDTVRASIVAWSQVVFNHEFTPGGLNLSLRRLRHYSAGLSADAIRVVHFRGPSSWVNRFPRNANSKLPSPHAQAWRENP